MSLNTAPQIEGVTFDAPQQIHNGMRWRFYVDAAYAAQAANSLIQALHQYSHLTLSDPSTGDSESTATIRLQGQLFQMMVGGHGWSGDWAEISREEAVQAVQSRVQYNVGQSATDFGYLYA